MSTGETEFFHLDFLLTIFNKGFSNQPATLQLVLLEIPRLDSFRITEGGDLASPETGGDCWAAQVTVSITGELPETRPRGTKAGD